MKPANANFWIEKEGELGALEKLGGVISFLRRAEMYFYVENHQSSHDSHAMTLFNFHSEAYVETRDHCREKNNCSK